MINWGVFYYQHPKNCFIAMDGFTTVSAISASGDPADHGPH